MLNQGMVQFAGKRVLLLQGPVGPFFARLAVALRAHGAQVHKVNFNAGDWFFYPRGAVNYRGGMAAWPDWLKVHLQRLRIDVVFLFGDCRPIHTAAHDVATRLGIEVAVFEEGYVRPDYVTLERFGVNGRSQLSRLPQAYNEPNPAVPPRRPVVGAYWPMVWWGFWYFTVGGLGKPFFPRYAHHRALSILEALPWIRAVWRKHGYRWAERGTQDRLTTTFSQRFFLAPLQVYNDAQVLAHSDLDDVPHFISTTLRSFARHAPRDTLLVFKHHPMDRGYTDYTHLVRRLARQAGVSERVLYIHDQHLPSLLDHARGVVVINSTVGLSALHHGVTTMVVGNALYDMPGLTYQGELDEFWRDAPAARPDAALYRRFRDNLIARTQLNGSFYKPLTVPEAVAGLIWGGGGEPIPTPSGLQPMAEKPASSTRIAG